MSRIPKAIQDQIAKIVDEFNEEKLGDIDAESRYVFICKGHYIYINTIDGMSEEPACRLRYDGDLDDLFFEIYKFSTGKYTYDTFMMPGEEYEDGTLKGALNCVFEMYPPL
jgi:hypothetical protein